MCKITCLRHFYRGVPRLPTMRVVPNQSCAKTLIKVWRQTSIKVKTSQLWQSLGKPNLRPVGRRERKVGQKVEKKIEKKIEKIRKKVLFFSI